MRKHTAIKLKKDWRVQTSSSVSSQNPVHSDSTMDGIETIDDRQPSTSLVTDSVTNITTNRRTTTTQLNIWNYI